MRLVKTNVSYITISNTENVARCLTLRDSGAIDVKSCSLVGWKSRWETWERQRLKIVISISGRVGQWKIFEKPCVMSIKAYHIIYWIFFCTLSENRLVIVHCREWVPINNRTYQTKKCNSLCPHKKSYQNLNEVTFVRRLMRVTMVTGWNNI